MSCGTSYLLSMIRWMMAAFLFLSPLSARAEAMITILAFGDSLTAGYGLDPDEAFPVRLEAVLNAKGHKVRVINAGVSGDTSAAGRDRLDWALSDDVDAVIVELGANDALRGMSPDQTRAALSAILATLKARKIPTLVAGMMAPRNLGPDYAAAFDPIFAELARQYNAIFYPFFLEGVAMRADLNQADGIHPDGHGVDEIVKRMTPKVEELIARAAAK
jgi:acyl-CoA thioesterase I